MSRKRHSRSRSRSGRRSHRPARMKSTGMVRVSRVEATSDCLTDRAGLLFFVRYLEQTGIYSLLERLFGSVRKSRKGLPVWTLFKQLFCFFADGTSLHLTRFDELAADEGYAGTIECSAENMASSHCVKRFLKGFSFVRNFLFRRVLQRLFVWRLRCTNPSAIRLDIDTTVMDNDDAHAREGVKPTYKRKKGFQPLHVTWGPYVVDAVFRSGSKHSNHGDTVRKAIEHLVALIRREYRADVPILLSCDSGFFDDKNFSDWERLGIGYIAAGKLYEDVLEAAKGFDEAMWEPFSNGREHWRFVEFGNRRACWKTFRRTIYCQLCVHHGQGLLEFARPDTVIHTNLGMGGRIDELLKAAGEGAELAADSIVAGMHARGAAELVHRAVKDFGTEKLPFKRFEPNTAFYYTMLVAYNLFEAFKADAVAPTIPVASYATTVRRQLLDVAGKLIRKSRQTVLKLTQAAIERLDLMQLWERVNRPLAVALA